MVAVQSRLDDVLLALKNKKVEADRQVTRTIPAYCSPTGKTQRITLDVSEEGLRELERLDEKHKGKLLEAGAVYGKLSDTRKAARAAKPARKSMNQSDPETSTDDTTNTVEAEEAGDDESTSSFSS